MATIIERKWPSGRITWKVALRKRGLPGLFLTFDDLEEACDWVEKNEKEFYKDPDKYFAWKEKIYYEMQRMRKVTHRHMLKCKSIFRS